MGGPGCVVCCFGSARRYAVDAEAIGLLNNVASPLVGDDCGRRECPYDATHEGWRYILAIGNDFFNRLLWDAGGSRPVTRWFWVLASGQEKHPPVVIYACPCV